MKSVLDPSNYAHPMVNAMQPVIPHSYAGRSISPAYYHQEPDAPIDAADFYHSTNVDHMASSADTGPFNPKALADLAASMMPQNAFIIFPNPRSTWIPDF